MLQRKICAKNRGELFEGKKNWRLANRQEQAGVSDGNLPRGGKPEAMRCWESVCWRSRMAC